MEKHNSELQTVLTDLTETIYQAKGNNLHETLPSLQMNKC